MDSAVLPSGNIKCDVTCFRLGTAELATCLPRRAIDI